MIATPTSTAAITDENGNLVERLAYDPFGARRYPDGRIDLSNSLRSLTTERGFTGHEHLDDLGFVHMNGRVYDPNLGRFLSPDPFIQYPDNLQSYNRYSYLFNNPLNATDPSGYFSWGSLGRAFDDMVRHWSFNTVANFNFEAFQQANIGQRYIDGYLMKHDDMRQLYVGANVAAAGIVCSIFGGPTAGAGCAAGASAFWSSYYAFYQTHDGEVAFNAGMQAGTTSFMASMLFYGAGQFGAASGSYAGYLAAHAAAGCASAMMQDQNCGRGAAAAALAKGVTLGMDSMLSGMDKQSWEYHAYNFSATVVAGGAAAQIAGGKFVNGAVTAAYGYIFNNMSDRALASRIASRAPYETLGDNLIGFVDRFTENGEARHEIHVYDQISGKEVGVYKEGSFFNKHGIKASSIELSEKVLERLNGIDIARLTAQGRVNLVTQIKAVQPWRAFTRVPVLGIVIGLIPFAAVSGYTWQDYLGDSLCGVAGGCSKSY